MHYTINPPWNPSNPFNQTIESCLIIEYPQKRPGGWGSSKKHMCLALCPAHGIRWNLVLMPGKIKGYFEWKIRYLHAFLGFGVMVSFRFCHSCFSLQSVCLGCVLWDSCNPWDFHCAISIAKFLGAPRTWDGTCGRFPHSHQYRLCAPAMCPTLFYSWCKVFPCYDCKVIEQYCSTPPHPTPCHDVAVKQV